MDSFKFQNVRMEKASAISRYRGIQRITTLFRFAEAFVFLIILSRFSTRFAFSFNLSREYFRGISVTLISPRFVFLIGNAIVFVLFFISGQFSAQKRERVADFYDEYVEKCRINNQQTCDFSDEKKLISRSRSDQNLVRRTVNHGEERRRDLRRSMIEKCHKTVDDGRKLAVAAAAGVGSSYAEDDMSSEEFRRTVEAFIARQQRFLREEEEFSSAVVSFQS